MFNKKKSLFKKRHQTEDMSLQITSLADIFVIILVFLLKSYSTGATMSPAKGLLMPEAQAAEASIDALKIEIAEAGISVEGQPVAPLKSFRFESGELQGNGSSKTLSKALERERQKQLLIAKGNSDVKVDPKIVVISDQRVPYATIKSVLASAALNGYTDFKLAVVKGE